MCSSEITKGFSCSESLLWRAYIRVEKTQIWKQGRDPGGTYAIQEKTGKRRSLAYRVLFPAVYGVDLSALGYHTLIHRWRTYVATHCAWNNLGSRSNLSRVDGDHLHRCKNKTQMQTILLGDFFVFWWQTLVICSPTTALLKLTQLPSENKVKY